MMKKKQSIISDRQDEAYNNAVESYKKDIDINVNDKEWSKVAFVPVKCYLIPGLFPCCSHQAAYG